MSGPIVVTKNGGESIKLHGHVTEYRLYEKCQIFPCRYHKNHTTQTKKLVCFSLEDTQSVCGPIFAKKNGLESIKPRSTKNHQDQAQFSQNGQFEGGHAANIGIVEQSTDVLLVLGSVLYRCVNFRDETRSGKAQIPRDKKGMKSELFRIFFMLVKISLKK